MKREENGERRKEIRINNISAATEFYTELFVIPIAQLGKGKLN